MNPSFKERVMLTAFLIVETVFVAKTNTRTISKPTVEVVDEDGQKVAVVYEDLTYECSLCIAGRALALGAGLGALVTYVTMTYL
jgi:hypothetical protein